MENQFYVGTLLSIPCNIFDGPISSEKIISCNLNTQPPIKIEGIVSEEMTKQNNRVITVISSIDQNSATLFFNGEMISPRNPVKVPIQWLQENAELEKIVQ